MSELPESEHIVVDTEQPLSATLEKVHALVETWPLGLTG